MGLLQNCSFAIAPSLALVFPLFPFIAWLVVDPITTDKNCKAHGAGGTAQCEVLVMVGECYGVEAFGEIQSNHCIANQHSLHRLAVYRCKPIAVLGD